jgi:hypothetical protein
MHFTLARNAPGMADSLFFRNSAQDGDNPKRQDKKEKRDNGKRKTTSESKETGRKFQHC